MICPWLLKLSIRLMVLTTFLESGSHFYYGHDSAVLPTIWLCPKPQPSLVGASAKSLKPPRTLVYEMSHKLYRDKLGLSASQRLRLLQLTVHK